MALPARPFWFLRHGETDLNAARLAQGAGIDAGLNATGRAQAERAGPLLAGQEITTIIASPLQRARQTAEIINEFLRLPLSIEPDLREVAFGSMEGKPLLPWFPDWLEGRATPDGAESFAALTRRVEAVLRRILKTQQGPVLLVAHGGVFRAMRELMGLPKEGRTAHALPIFCDHTGEGWQATSPDLGI